MSQIPVTESMPYTEHDKNQWRFTVLGLRWTSLGVGLTALSVLSLLVLYIAIFSITAPQKADAARGLLDESSMLYSVMTYGSMASAFLGFLAIMIGLTLNCFAPRPGIAKFFSLGSLILYVLSSVGFARTTMLLLYTFKSDVGDNIRIDSGWAMIELTSVSLTALSESFVSSILLCCFLFAVAAEFSKRELIQGVQKYLIMLFFSPALMIFLGAVYSGISKSKNAQHYTWFPIVGFVILALVFLGMCYWLYSLLQAARRAIEENIEPGLKLPFRTKAPPPVIDPLAD